MCCETEDLHGEIDGERIGIATRELVFHIDEADAAIRMAGRELDLLLGELYDVELVGATGNDMRHELEVASRAMRNVLRAAQLRRTLLTP